MQTIRKRERAPVGIERTRPISLRLKVDERERLEAEARKHNRTVNAMTRKAVLAGLDIIDQETE